MLLRESSVFFFLTIKSITQYYFPIIVKISFMSNKSLLLRQTKILFSKKKDRQRYYGVFYIVGPHCPPSSTKSCRTLCKHTDKSVTIINVNLSFKPLQVNTSMTIRVADKKTAPFVHTSTPLQPCCLQLTQIISYFCYLESKLHADCSHLLHLFHFFHFYFNIKIVHYSLINFIFIRTILFYIRPSSLYINFNHISRVMMN